MVLLDMLALLLVSLVLFWGILITLAYGLIVVAERLLFR